LAFGLFFSGFGLHRVSCHHVRSPTVILWLANDLMNWSCTWSWGVLYYFCYMHHTGLACENWELLIH